MANGTSTLQTLGKKAKEYVAGLKSLPMTDSDIQGLKSTAQLATQNAAEAAGSNVAAPDAADPATFLQLQRKIIHDSLRLTP